MKFLIFLILIIFNMNAYSQKPVKKSAYERAKYELGITEDDLKAEQKIGKSQKKSHWQKPVKKSPYERAKYELGITEDDIKADQKMRKSQKDFKDLRDRCTMSDDKRKIDCDTGVYVLVDSQMNNMRRIKKLLKPMIKKNKKKNKEVTSD